MLKSPLLSSYLVMPFMQTDLQKIMGMEFSEDKVQYLVYQMLKGLKVSVACAVAKGCSVLRPSTLRWEGRGSDAGCWSASWCLHRSFSLFLSVHPLSWCCPQGECLLSRGPQGRNWVLWQPMTVLRNLGCGCFGLEKVNVVE